MKALVRELVLPAVGGGFALVGILSTLWVELVEMPALRFRCEARRSELQELSRLAVLSARYAPHLGAVDEMIGTAHLASDLLALFLAVAPGAMPPVLVGERNVELDEQRAIRQVDLAMADVPLDALAAFFHACSTSRPPWRVSALRLQALDAGSTRARAAVTLEGPIGRQEAAAR